MEEGDEETKRMDKAKIPPPALVHQSATEAGLKD